MILEPKSTSIAYRCPSCGSGIMSAVDVFKLSADRVRLKCTNPDCASVPIDIEKQLGLFTFLSECDIMKL